MGYNCIDLCALLMLKMFVYFFKLFKKVNFKKIFFSKNWIPNLVIGTQVVQSHQHEKKRKRFVKCIVLLRKKKKKRQKKKKDFKHRKNSPVPRNQLILHFLLFAIIISYLIHHAIFDLD